MYRFNPHAREGVTVEGMFSATEAAKFQSTRPRRRDRQGTHPMPHPYRFQSTRPRRRDHCTTDRWDAAATFQSTRPRRRDRAKNGRLAVVRTFQSTRPRRRDRLIYNSLILGEFRIKKCECKRRILMDVVEKDGFFKICFLSTGCMVCEPDLPEVVAWGSQFPSDATFMDMEWWMRSEDQWALQIQRRFGSDVLYLVFPILSQVVEAQTVHIGVEQAA